MQFERRIPLTLILSPGAVERKYMFADSTPPLIPSPLAGEGRVRGVVRALTRFM
jgi:hypothetical protein